MLTSGRTYYAMSRKPQVYLSMYDFLLDTKCTGSKNQRSFPNSSLMTSIKNCEYFTQYCPARSIGDDSDTENT